MSASKTTNNNTVNANANTGGTESKKKDSSNGYSIDQNKYRTMIDDIRSKNLNNPEMLIASVNHIIHPEDSIIYYPKNIHLLGNKYPVYPLRLKEELLDNFDIDTLFFMFYEQNELEVKEMARKQIVKRGWTLNPAYNIFYKIKGKPKEINEDYILADFDIFDNEKEWRIMPLTDFKMKLKKLNDLDKKI